ncbi:MAG: helix-turn-helix domain-containing protein [Microthrixaceae bacterium]
MPRISAASVAEHVAAQEAAVVRAAVALIAERGFERVTMADVAEAVGLKRNSLYRYVPDKGHLLGLWIRSEMQPVLDSARRIAASDDPAEVRLDRWVGSQFDLLIQPSHRQLLAAAASGLPDDVAEAVGRDHRALYGTLQTVIGACRPDDSHDRVADLATLVIGMTRAAAEAAEEHSANGLRSILLEASTAVVIRRRAPRPVPAEAPERPRRFSAEHR